MNKINSAAKINITYKLLNMTTENITAEDCKSRVNRRRVWQTTM